MDARRDATAVAGVVAPLTECMGKSMMIVDSSSTNGVPLSLPSSSMCGEGAGAGAAGGGATTVVMGDNDGGGAVTRVAAAVPLLLLPPPPLPVVRRTAPAASAASRWVRVAGCCDEGGGAPLVDAEVDAVVRVALVPRAGVRAGAAPLVGPSPFFAAGPLLMVPPLWGCVVTGVAEAPAGRVRGAPGVVLLGGAAAPPRGPPPWGTVRCALAVGRAPRFALLLVPTLLLVVAGLRALVLWLAVCAGLRAACAVLLRAPPAVARNGRPVMLVRVEDCGVDLVALLPPPTVAVVFRDWVVAPPVCVCHMGP